MVTAVAEHTEPVLTVLEAFAAVHAGNAKGRVEAERLIRHMSWTQRRQLHDAALELVVLTNTFRIGGGLS